MIPARKTRLITVIESLAAREDAVRINTIKSDGILMKLHEYNTKAFNLPEGIPNIDLKYVGETMIAQELRRLYLFVDGAPVMKDSKREQLFLDMVQGLDEEEGALLWAVKDGTMLSLYPQLQL